MITRALAHRSAASYAAGMAPIPGRLVARRPDAGGLLGAPPWLTALALAAALLGGCAAPRGHPPGLPAAGVAPNGGRAPAGEALPTDPALVTGMLDNGLAYVVKRHGNPSGRAAFWLHVATGSLNEDEETRGIAHYLEHLAFNGSANFPPGALVPYFESIGLAFGRDQNAFTSLDRTVYQIALPDTRPDTLGKALLYLGDVAMRLSLLPEEIDRERQIILEEKRARAGGDQRVRDQVFARLAPGSTLGRRPPIGTEETIGELRLEHFRDFYARWYVPSNMTVLAVCDCDPALVVAKIAQEFAHAPRAPRPPPRPVGVTRTSGTRAIVVTDRDLARASVSFSLVEPPRPPTTTVADLRRDLVERLGVRAFNRRLEARLAEGRATFLEAGAYVTDWARAARLVTARASGLPLRWPAMLAELAATVQQARAHGFGERELDAARRALLAEVDVEREATLPARAVLRQLNNAVARGEPAMSAPQRRTLLERLLPGIGADEVSRTFAEIFDFADVVVVATLPAHERAPDEGELAVLGRTALAARPERPADRAVAATLLAAPPPPGRVAERAEHSASGVTSVWLGNDVRVHHRFVDQRRHEASVRITLAGGQIEETAANRGLTRAAVLAWERAATATLTSTEVRELMTGRRVRVTGRADADALTLVVAGNLAEIEHGLQLAYRLLTDPVVEAAAFAQWQESEIQGIAARRTRPAGVLGETLADAIYPPEEQRTRPLTAEQVRGITRDAAQAWLARLVREAPIEVAVVGDLERDRALDLAVHYLGALPARSRIGAGTFSRLRAVARPIGPISVTRTVETATPHAVVLDGFFGADITNAHDTRRLAMAARVLSMRMNRTVREERQLVYSIHASSRPAAEYPGFGLFVAQAPTEAAKTDALARTLEDLFAAFAAGGPTDEEVRVARTQILNALAETLAGPDFWVDRLATLDYRGIRLDDVVGARDDYAVITAAEVRETFARYYTPAARIRIVVTPR
jgi:zinc protease